jgi:hypothetical protein
MEIEEERKKKEKAVNIKSKIRWPHVLSMHGEVTKEVPMLPQKLMFGHLKSATTTHALMRATNTSTTLFLIKFMFIELLNHS